MKTLTIVVAGLAFLGPAVAGTNTWTSLGPFGGDTRVLAVDPQNAGTVYAATFGYGVFKTTDAGKTWISASIGLTNSSIQTLAIDPLHRGTVYAGSDDGVFKTTDGGLTWNASGAGLPKSTFNTYINALAIDPQDTATIYVSLSTVGVFKSADGGATWNAMNWGLPSNPGVNSITVDPFNTGAVYFANYFGVYKSSDGGANWSSLNSGGCCTSSSLVAIAAPATLYVVANGLWKSMDGGRSWVKTGWSSAYAPSTLTLDPNNPDTIYAASGGMVFKSMDGGANWNAGSLVSGGSVAGVVLDPRAPGTAYAATTDGAYSSTDGGLSWNASNTGLAAAGVHFLAVDQTNSDTLFTSATYRLFKSTDAGANWSAEDYLSPGGVVADLVVDTHTPSTIYAGTFGDPDFGGSGGVFKSIDGGSTWSKPVRASKTETLSVNQLVVDPQNSDTLYAAIGTQNFGYGSAGLNGGVLTSTDGGATWSAASSGLPSIIAVSALSIDPQAPQTLYAGTGRDLAYLAPNAILGGVFKSADGGGSWSPSSFGLPLDTISSLFTDPNISGTVYALTGSGVFKTTDGGLSWAATNAGLPPTGVTALSMDPKTSGTLYAATANVVFKTIDGGKNWNALSYPGLPVGRVSQLVIGSQALYAVVAGNVLGITFGSLSPRAPILLSVPGDGQGQGAILHAGTNQVASATNPAAAGEVLEIYCTGLSSGPGAVSRQVIIGGVQAEILFSGNAPGFAGLNQVNIRVPSGITPGAAVAVRLVDSGFLSNEVTIGAQ